MAEASYNPQKPYTNYTLFVVKKPCFSPPDLDVEMILLPTSCTRLFAVRPIAACFTLASSVFQAERLDDDTLLAIQMLPCCELHKCRSTRGVQPLPAP